LRVKIMATRYWVGDDGDWTPTGTTNWSSSSGGAGGASAPGADDDVIFNENSFSANGKTVTVLCIVLYVKSISFLSVTNNPHVDLSAISQDILIVVCGGDFTLSAGMTIDSNLHVQPQLSITPCRVTSAGHFINTYYGVSEIFDDIDCYSFTITSSFTTNNHDISANLFQINIGQYGVSISISLGSSIITVTKPESLAYGLFVIWDNVPADTIYIDCGTAIINLPAQIYPPSSGNIKIEGNSTALVTMTGTNWQINCPGGTIEAKYVVLENSHAGGGALFIASPSQGCVDEGGNTGWAETGLPPTDGFFRVEVYVSDLLVRSVSGITGDTWIYTEAMNIADNGSPATVVTFKVSNYRTVSGHTYESDQAEVICKKN
jgi:hypothetical protein